MDYTPPKKLKALQEKELELLKAVILVCNRNHIPYFLMHGSLIGAIRHGGIIPWDDDIDIAVFRKDYKHFFEACRVELPEPYFVQFNTTDITYTVPHIKIRNSSTTAITQNEYDYFKLHKGKNCKLNYNMGIFLDVFPLDSLPADKKALSRYIKELKFFNRLVNLYYISKVDVKTLKGKFLYLFLRIFCRVIPIRIVFTLYNRLIQRYKNSNSPLVGYTWSYWDIEKHIWQRSWFERCKTVPFNDISVQIPEEYDALLRQEYGDYMTPVITPSDHGNLKIIDIERSYMNYTKMGGGGLNLLIYSFCTL